MLADDSRSDDPPVYDNLSSREASESERFSDSRSESRSDDSPAPRQPIYRDFLLIQFAVLVFFLDQFSKYLVREFLPLYHSWPVDGFFRITHTFNTGSIFGLFQGQNATFILVSFLGVAVLMLLYRIQRFPTGLLRLSLGLQLGGAFGNLLDRVRLGHVTDWVDVSVWPVFNVADACIVTGLVVLAWLFTMSERQRGRGDVHPDAYSFCPICDGEMRALPSYGNGVGSWRCSTCGVRERQLPIALPNHLPVDSEPLDLDGSDSPGTVHLVPPSTEHAAGFYPGGGGSLPSVDSEDIPSVGPGPVEGRLGNPLP